jgi:hypothetical protein
LRVVAEEESTLAVAVDLVVLYIKLELISL